MIKDVRELSPIEEDEIATRTRALTENQIRVVLANLRTTDMQAELSRRTMYANRKIDMICSVMNEWSESIQDQSENNLVTLQKFIKELKDVLL